MPPRPVTAALGILVLLTACGEESARPSAQEPTEAVVLTDELMEKYVGIARAMRARDAEAPSVEALQAAGWSLKEWTTVSIQVGQAFRQMAVAEMEDRLPETLARIDGLEARIAAADGEAREALELQLQSLRNLATRSAGADQELARRNRAVLERWLPRLEDARGD